MHDDRGRRWSLESARAILPEVRERTANAHAQVEALVASRSRLSADRAARVEVEGKLSRVVSRWIRAMEALGVDVEGAWLVDFDCGRGCYCWRWPEQRVEFFHDYESGFEGRIRIQ
jgi:hypothetical protein